MYFVDIHVYCKRFVNILTPLEGCKIILLDNISISEISKDKKPLFKKIPYLPLIKNQIEIRISRLSYFCPLVSCPGAMIHAQEIKVECNVTTYVLPAYSEIPFPITKVIQETKLLLLI